MSSSKRSNLMADWWAHQGEPEDREAPLRAGERARHGWRAPDREAEQGLRSAPGEPEVRVRCLDW